MGEIIKFDFINKKKIIEKETGGGLKEESFKKEETNEGFSLFIKFIDFSISDKCKKLNNLQVTKEALFNSIGIVKNYTNEELIGWLENSNESDFSAKPSFFRAIYEELKTRMSDHP